MKKLNYQPDIDALRREAYPPIEDFIDAMYWQQQGKPALLQQYFAKVAEVKARLPKASN